jgi:hypothetical protein
MKMLEFINFYNFLGFFLTVYDIYAFVFLLSIFILLG